MAMKTHLVILGHWLGAPPDLCYKFVILLDDVENSGPDHIEVIRVDLRVHKPLYELGDAHVQLFPRHAFFRWEQDHDDFNHIGDVADHRHHAEHLQSDIRGLVNSAGGAPESLEALLVQVIMGKVKMETWGDGGGLDLL